LDVSGEEAMRAVEKKEARGSLKWIRYAVNDCRQLFDQQVKKESGIPEEDRITWVSPLKEDEYAEYRDQDFLNRLGLTLTKRSLDSFWPNWGPQWDALGRTGTGRIILLEAKANIPEIVSSATGAGPKSRVLIENSIAETQKFLGSDKNISWTGKLYQYTNRLAHLYLLRELNGVDAHLVFVYFVGAKDVNGPRTIAEWKSALTVAKLVLGLKERHKLSKYVSDIFIDIGQIDERYALDSF
jgi:hypothetical protein